MPEGGGGGEPGICTQSAVNGGGNEIWSCKAENHPDHLVIMVNGIMGSANDWKFAAEEIVKSLPDKVIVHCSQRNVSKLTLDGIDVMGTRLAEEVKEVVDRMPEMRKISFIAHSVGGLVARYAIGRLYEPPPADKYAKENIHYVGRHEEAIGTISGLEPINFITVATPHLGSRGNKQVPFLFGLSAMEKLACHVIHLIFRTTGQQLFLVDGKDGDLPLLERMLTDSRGLNFISALKAFKRRVTYANANFDHIVGWRTASIRRNCELPKWEGCVNERYPHVVHMEESEAGDLHSEATSTTGSESEILEEKLLVGLRCLSWERIDVSFHTCKMKSAAHSVIQVKDSSIHFEGADVILHIIDHFLC